MAFFVIEKTKTLVTCLFKASNVSSLRSLLAVMPVFPKLGTINSSSMVWKNFLASQDRYARSPESNLMPAALYLHNTSIKVVWEKNITDKIFSFTWGVQLACLKKTFFPTKLVSPWIFNLCIFHCMFSLCGKYWNDDTDANLIFINHHPERERERNEMENMCWVAIGSSLTLERNPWSWTMCFVY